jgi:hypothetical protein
MASKAGRARRVRDRTVCLAHAPGRKVSSEPEDLFALGRYASRAIYTPKVVNCIGNLDKFHRGGCAKVPFNAVDCTTHALDGRNHRGKCPAVWQGEPTGQLKEDSADCIQEVLDPWLVLDRFVPEVFAESGDSSVRVSQVRSFARHERRTPLGLRITRQSLFSSLLAGNLAIEQLIGFTEEGLGLRTGIRNPCHVPVLWTARLIASVRLFSGSSVSLTTSSSSSTASSLGHEKG